MSNERVKNAVQHAGGSLMRFDISIAPEVFNYRRTHAASPDEPARPRRAGAPGLKLWSLTPLLALTGQLTDRLFYLKGHWTAAAHPLVAR
jgi:hypothetical protein